MNDCKTLRMDLLVSEEGCYSEVINNLFKFFEFKDSFLVAWNEGVSVGRRSCGENM